VSTRNPSVLSLATHQQPLDVGPAPPSFAPSRLRALRFAKMYSRFDKLADFVDSLYFARFALFIIGHAILFTPSPKEETTCYHSAPFLWWGVFVGLLYDWARIATWILIAFVAVILMAKSLAAHLYNVSDTKEILSVLLLTISALCNPNGMEGTSSPASAPDSSSLTDHVGGASQVQDCLLRSGPGGPGVGRWT
jgi:hypothetical protein